MNKLSVFILFVTLLSVSCGDSMEKKAQALVAEARVAYENQNYNVAKLLLDSVRTVYPKAFKARREALELSRDVEMGEQTRSLEFYEEELSALIQRRDSMLSGFVLEKDRRYQDIGYYMKASQTVKNNIGNSYLRAQVDENGVAAISSVYRGKAISHTTVKVSAGDTYAECDAPFNKYTSKHLGVTTERLDFRYMQDGGIMTFIAETNQPITVELYGKGKYTYKLRKEDAEAVAEVLRLTVVLQAIDSVKNMRDEAKRHIDFLKRSKERFETQSNKENSL